MSEHHSPVDTLMAEHEGLLKHLLDSGETSYHAVLEGTVPKVFLLAAASWMEARVRQILIEFFEEATNGYGQAQEFIRQKAIERNYHALFNWESRTPSKFFSGFGDEVRNYTTRLHREDGEYAAQCAAFLELGELRNQLVHQNYANFTLQKTAAEVGALYEVANKFVERLPALLRSDPFKPVTDSGSGGSSLDVDAETSHEASPSPSVVPHHV